MDDSPFDTDPNLWNAPRPASVPPPIPVAEVLAPAMAWRMGFTPPPRVWPVFVAFGLYFAGQIVLGLIIGIYMTVTRGGFDPALLFEDLDMVLLLLGGAVMSAGLAGFGAGILSPVPMRERLGLGRARGGLVIWIVAPVATYAISLGFVSMLSALQLEKWIGEIGTIDNLIAPAPLWKQLFALLVIALGAGLGEEVLFRGYMQRRLTQRIGAGWSILIVSTLFGFAHANIVQTPFAFLLGLFVGLLAYRTDSIWPAIWCHAFSNLMAVMVSMFLPDYPPTIDLLIVLGCMMMVGVGVLSVLWSTRPINDAGGAPVRGRSMG